MKIKLRNVSIRFKVVLIIIFSILTFSSVVYFVSTGVLLKSYLSIEKEETIKNIKRANDAIENTVSQLNIKLTDWSKWDDTYKFINDKNQAYIKSNLTEASLKNLELDGMIFIDVTGKVVYKKLINQEKNQPIVLDEIINVIYKNKNLIEYKNTNSYTSGIMYLSNGPFIFVSQPILNSNGIGPMRGSLIFIQSLDNQKIKNIEKLTHLFVNIYSYDSSSIEISSAKNNLLTLNDEYFLDSSSENIIAGYSIIRDVNNNPILIMKVVTSREIYNQGKITFNLFMFMASIAIFLFGLLIIFLLERFFIKRFTRLMGEIKNISETNDFSLRVYEGNKDEMGQMALTVNHMLLEVEKSKFANLTLLNDLEIEKKKVDEIVVIRTKELSYEKARLLASINSLDIGFAVVDNDGLLIVNNPALVNLLEFSTGIKSLEDISKKFKDNLHLFKRLKECIDKKSIVEIKEISFGSKYFRIFLTPVFSSENDKESLGGVIIIENITEMKVIERSREEFFALASHELRTPLTVIKGNTEMILDMYVDKLPKETKEMLTDIDGASIRLIDLVNDFLEVSLLEQKTIDTKKEIFYLPNVIDKVIRDFKIIAENKNIILSVSSEINPIINVVADQKRIEQVLVNLIGNAIKFTNKGEVNISIKKMEGFLKVIVSDTGIGISEKNQNLLFRKFQQAGEQVFARDVVPGTGLGLYISYLLISKMGGTIGLVKSELGVGSIFAFTLPLA